MVHGTHPLAAWLDRHGLTHVEFGALIGANNATVSRLIRGERKAGLRLALAIAQATSGEIPADFWLRASRPASSRRRRAA